MLKFIREHFIPDEPMSKSVNLHWDAEMEELTLGSLEQNLTVAMVSSASGEIIGGQVVTVEDRSNNFDKTKWKSKALVQVFDVCFNQLNNLSNIFDYFNVEEVVHLYQLGVHQKHRHKGIGTKLIMAVKELVRSFDIGPVVLRVEGSSNFSKLIFEKLGFETLAEIIFANYEDEGKIVFANTGEHNSVRLYGMIV